MRQVFSFSFLLAGLLISGTSMLTAANSAGPRLSERDLSRIRGSDGNTGQDTADCSKSNLSAGQVPHDACIINYVACVKCEGGTYLVAGPYESYKKKLDLPFYCTGRKWVGECFLGFCDNQGEAGYCSAILEQYGPQ